MTSITIRNEDTKIEGITLEDDFPSAVELFIELASKLFNVDCNSVLTKGNYDRDTSSGD